MQLSILFAYLLAGFLAGPHCAGMCGGLIVAGNLGAAPRRIWLLLNLGRCLAYVAGGALMGAGSTWLISRQIGFVSEVLTIVAALMISGMGLSLLGYARVTLYLEGLGRGPWQKIRPFWQRAWPPQKAVQALYAGFLWGFLPCGLIYSMWVSALNSHSVFWGGAYLAAYGLGTMPNVLALGWLSHKHQWLLKKTGVRTIFGCLIVVLGGLQLARLFI